MNISVSGVTSLKQLEQLDGMNVDMAGIEFFRPNPRFAGDMFSRGAIKKADLDIKAIGIFNNPEYDEVMEMIEFHDLDLIQLQGEASPELCEAFSDSIEVIKVFKIDESKTKSLDALLKDYDDACDYFLFDTAPKKGVGSEGKKFDWKKLMASRIEKPFFLKGGLRPEDAALLKSFKHPDFYAVDLDTHFEKSPGVKNMALILQFMQGLKMRKD